MCLISSQIRSDEAFVELCSVCLTDVRHNYCRYCFYQAIKRLKEKMPSDDDSEELTSLTFRNP